MERSLCAADPAAAINALIRTYAGDRLALTRIATRCGDIDDASLRRLVELHVHFRLRPENRLDDGFIAAHLGVLDRLLPEITFDFYKRHRRIDDLARLLEPMLATIEPPRRGAALIDLVEPFFEHGRAGLVAPLLARYRHLRGGTAARLEELRHWQERAGRAAAGGHVRAVDIEPADRLLYLPSYHLPVGGSRNTGDMIQTLAMLGAVVSAGLPLRHGCGEARQLAGRLRDACRQSRPMLDGEPITLAFLPRDDARQGEVPAGWLVAGGWFMHRRFGRFEFPFHPAIEPLFVSFHIDDPALLTPEAIDYLKAKAPIGCRDWFTTGLLRAHGIDAFFSGCLTSTLGQYYPRPEGPRLMRYYADYVRRWQRLPHALWPVAHNDDRLLTASPGQGLRIADRLLRRYARARRVDTRLLHAHLPCRAIGTESRFKPRYKGDRRFDGLVGIDDESFARMGTTLADRLREILRLVAGGADPATVRHAWARLWSAERAEAAARFDPARAAPQEVDVDGLVAGVVRRDFNTEAPEATHVAFAFDDRLQPYVANTLASLVRHAAGPLTLHLLTRGVGQDGIAELASRFPMAAIRHYDLGAVDHGKVKTYRHVSISTMDRLLLPALADCARLVYLDIDILVRADIAELARIDLGGHAIAARPGYGHPRAIATIATATHRRPPEVASGMWTYLFSRAEPDFAFFNAGVLVMDIQRLRRENAAGRALALVRAWGIDDQIALNCLMAGDFAAMPDAWNMYSGKDLMDDPKLVHFVGPLKPWSDGIGSRYVEAWRAAVSPA